MAQVGQVRCHEKSKFYEHGQKSGRAHTDYGGCLFDPAFGIGFGFVVGEPGRQISRGTTEE